MTRITIGIDVDLGEFKSIGEQAKLFSLIHALEEHSSGQPNGQSQQHQPGPADPRFANYQPSPASDPNSLTKEQAQFHRLFGYFPPRETEEIQQEDQEKRDALKALKTHGWRKGTPFWDLRT